MGVQASPKKTTSTCSIKCTQVRLLATSVLSQNGPAVRVEVSEMGREAHTEYEVLERNQVPGSSLEFASVAVVLCFAVEDCAIARL